MGFFNNFPYTNFHEMNLDWILSTLRSVSDKVDSVPEQINKIVSEKLSEYDIPGEIGKVLVNYGLALSVKNYGAVGDGVTDDSEAFQKWLEDVITGDTVGFIPPGEYYIRSGIIQYGEQINNHRWAIMGAGTGATVLKFEYTRENCLSLRYCKNFTVSNFTIKCPGWENQTYGYGIYLVDCNNAFFINIDITNCSRGGVLAYSSDPDNIVLSNLMFDNVNIYGVENKMPFSETDSRILYPCGFILENVVDSKVSNCYVENIKQFTFEFKDYCHNSQYVNCVAKDCVTAVYAGVEHFSDKYSTSCKWDIKCINTEKPVVLGHCIGHSIKVELYNDEAISGDTIVRADYSTGNIIDISGCNVSGTGVTLLNDSTKNRVRLNLTNIVLPYTPVQCGTVSGNFIDIGGIEDAQLVPDRIGNNVALTDKGFFGSFQHIFNAGLTPLNSAGDFKFSGKTCDVTYDADNANPKFMFRNSGASGYVQMEFDIANKRIVCRFNDGSSTSLKVIQPDA